MVIRALFVSLALGLAAAPAVAADKPGEGKPAASTGDAVEAHGAALAKLFDQLKQAKDEAEAKSLAAEIERLWSLSGSPTADLLLKRATAAMQADQSDIALDILDSVLTLQPDWAEAWNRRATLLFLRKDLDGSMRDIAHVLALEPRHFGAWAGLGMIMLKVDNKKQALAAFKRALEINPQVENAQKAVEKLTKELDGSDI